MKDIIKCTICKHIFVFYCEHPVYQPLYAAWSDDVVDHVLKCVARVNLKFSEVEKELLKKGGE